MFSVSEAQALKQALPEIDFRQPAQPGAALESYLQHYGLDFQSGADPKTHDVHHAMGFFMAGHRRIACQYFQPQNPVATVVLVHGYYDHIGLYGHLIRYCLHRRYAVVAFDLPGHGLSEGDAAAIDSFSEYTDALQVCLQGMSKAELARPYHGLGQSTGCSVLMDYCQTHCEPGSSALDHVVLLAPLVRPSHWARGRWLHTVARLFVSGIAREFAVNSHDEAFLRFVREKDPLQSRRLTVRWVSALKQWLLEFAARRPCLRPLIVIQGTGDTTVDWQYNLKAIARQFPSVQISMLEDARHHLANESQPYRERVYAVLDKYL
ncbi:MAG: alpha/beta hydrolase [Pseudomonadales bacterium]|nr:alpha/beta hydrolase [Pseudomonadales bacterium]